MSFKELITNDLEDFNLPGFDWTEIDDPSHEYCFFHKPTNFYVGSAPIFYGMMLEREKRGEKVKVYFGVQAGLPRWSEMSPSGNGADLSLQQTVERLKNEGVFISLAEEMYLEYQKGYDFLNNELVPAVSSRFPIFDTVFDRYANFKDILFIDLAGEQALIWEIHTNSFTSSAGEVKIIEDGDDVKPDFTVGGQAYWVTNRMAIWYQTEKRNTTYQEGDWGRRTELLNQSLDTTMDIYLKELKR